MRWLVSALAPPWSLSTRDTVIGDTPAARATSAMVILDSGSLGRLNRIVSLESAEIYDNDN